MVISSSWCYVYVHPGCGVRPANVRCMMSAGAKAATPERVGLPVLDAQAAELKAERLWGMADARKPRPSQKGDVDVSEVSTGFFSLLMDFARRRLDVPLYTGHDTFSGSFGFYTPFFLNVNCVDTLLSLFVVCLGT